jgi:hypothetical protein
MSGVEQAYLGMAIGAAVLFMAVLAWACVYTAGGKRNT